MVPHAGRWLAFGQYTIFVFQLVSLDSALRSHFDPFDSLVLDARPETKMEIEGLATIAVDCGFKVHEALGPGLLETVYETVLCESLIRRGLAVERQRPVPVRLEGLTIDEGFRADLVVEGRLLIELKAIERTAPVHFKQVLTYLRLMGLPLGLLMNFGAATFREGVNRVANNRVGFDLGPGVRPIFAV